MICMTLMSVPLDYSVVKVQKVDVVYCFAK